LEQISSSQEWVSWPLVSHSATSLHCGWRALLRFHPPSRLSSTPFPLHRGRILGTSLRSNSIPFLVSSSTILHRLCQLRVSLDFSTVIPQSHWSLDAFHKTADFSRSIAPICLLLLAFQAPPRIRRSCPKAKACGLPPQNPFRF